MRQVFNWCLLILGLTCLGFFMMPGRGLTGSTSDPTNVFSTLGPTWTTPEECWYKRTLSLKDGDLQEQTEIHLTSWGCLFLLGGFGVLLLRCFIAQHTRSERLVSTLLVVGTTMVFGWMMLGREHWNGDGVFRWTDSSTGKNQLPASCGYDEVAIGVFFVTMCLLYLVSIWQPPVRAKTAGV